MLTPHHTSSAPPSPREACGTGGGVINSTTISKNGLAISVKTTSCPDLLVSPTILVPPKLRGPEGTGSKGRSRSVLTEDVRGFYFTFLVDQQQTDPNMSSGTLECFDSGVLPSIDDCQSLADALEDLFRECIFLPKECSTSV